MLLDTGAASNKLVHNQIGVNETAPQANMVGVVISGSDNQLMSNVISGNDTDGVQISGSGTILTSNLIGTNSFGTAKVSNGGIGIAISGGTLVQIGPGNLISGNKDAGIEIGEAVSQVSISVNRIGTDILGKIGIANKTGISIKGAGNTVSNNTISGNATGIEIAKETGSSPLVENNIIQGNRIGTTLDGTAAIPNTEAGVRVANAADHNVIGAISDVNGTPVQAVNGINPFGNLISGNTKAGIIIEPGDAAGATSPLLNKIQGNLIGTDKTGTVALANGEDGIQIVDSPQNLIGSSGTEIPLARNVISGNGTNGVEIKGDSSSQNSVSGNFIGVQLDGVSALGNGSDGVLLSGGAHHNTIGGTDPNAGNTIAFNQEGVVLLPDAGCCNPIDPNLIFANATLGIDLDNTGAPLPNDPGDADAGANNLQNYPEFTRAFIGTSGNLVIQYKVDSARPILIMERKGCMSNSSKPTPASRARPS